jgi:hypothetical protein
MASGWWQRSWASAFGVLAPAFSALGIYEIVMLWPLVGTEQQVPSGDGVANEDDSAEVVHLFWGVDWTLTQEQGLLLLAVISGALGGLFYTMGIYSSRRSRDRFNYRDANWYWVRFVIGAGLGLAVYALMRAGLFLLGGEPSEDRPSAFAVLGVSIVVGLFTDKVLGKLKEIAGNFFASADELAEEPGVAGPLPVVTPRTLVRSKTGQQLEFRVANGGADLKVTLGDVTSTVSPTSADANTYVVPITDAYKDAESIDVALELASGEKWTMTIPVEAPAVPSVVPRAAGVLGSTAR